MPRNRTVAPPTHTHPIDLSNAKEHTMSIPQAVAIGLTGEQLSRTLTGTDEVSAGRSFVATGAGALLGGVASGAVVVSATAVGFSALAAVAAPVVVPLAIASGAVSFIRSLWD